MTYPQQGGYGSPQGGGYGPPPQPQGGGYGPPQPPGGGYGYPPPGPGGYGQYPPPRKNNNTGLVVGAVAVAVAAVVALVLVLALGGEDDSKTADDGGTSQEDSGLPNGIPGPNGSDSPGGSEGDEGGGGSEGGVSSPEELADLVVVVIETQNEDLIDQHACSSGDASQMKTDLGRLQGMSASGTVEGVQESGDSAQAVIELTIGGQSEAILTADMENDGDAWCVSGIQISGS